eukprot:4528161-Amphidinium_carterae.2
MKHACIVIVPMMSVVSFHPLIVNPSPLTVTYCFLASSAIGLIGTCSQNVVGLTLTAAPVAMIIAQKSLTCRSDCLVYQEVAVVVKVVFLLCVGIVSSQPLDTNSGCSHCRRSSSCGR